MSSTSRSAASCAFKYPVSNVCDDDIVREVAVEDDDARSRREELLLLLLTKAAAVDERVASERRRLILLWRNNIIVDLYAGEVVVSGGKWGGFSCPAASIILQLSRFIPACCRKYRLALPSSRSKGPRGCSKRECPNARRSGFFLYLFIISCRSL